MPPVTYTELEDEMWCHFYYLENLCDQIRAPWDLNKVIFSSSFLSLYLFIFMGYFDKDHTLSCCFMTCYIVIITIAKKINSGI